ncbi:MAG: FecR domain-containing protein [Bacteroidetes bacterium]|nr:FecR domain-containing protein [Bacteroidota bacterium]
MNEINIEKLEDLVMDNSFQDYVAGRNIVAVKKWEDWIQQHPSQQKEFDTAVQVTKVLLNARKKEVDIDKELSLCQILSRIEKDALEQKPLKRTMFSTWMKVAAALVVLLGISVLLYFATQFNLGFNNETAFNELIVPIGEKAQIVLADGSHVWINSGSKLRYPTNFNQKNRTVYLQGEAYFDVMKKKWSPFLCNN